VVGPHRDSGVLAGVPRVGYDRRSCTFAGSVESVLTYLGDPVDYDYVMGVSGLAFRRLWERDNPGNVGPLLFAPECVRRTFWALGYGFEIVSYRRGRDALLGALRRSLDEGRPVIGSGIVGPPECEVIAGYSEGGTVLHGWSYFQECGSEEYYARPHWFENAFWGNDVGVITLGPKGTEPLPAPRDVLVSSLRWAIELERSPKRPTCPDHVNGLAAYGAWADALEIDADYPTDEAQTMELRQTVLIDHAAMTCERHSAAAFLRQMARVVPEVAATLNEAAILYDQVGDEAGPIYPWGPNWGRPDIAPAAVRREIACHVRAAAEIEARAVTMLEQALAGLRE